MSKWEELALRNKMVVEKVKQAFVVSYFNTGKEPQLLCRLMQAVPSDPLHTDRVEIKDMYPITYISSTEELQISNRGRRLRISIDYDHTGETERFKKIYFAVAIDKIVRELIEYVWKGKIEFDEDALEHFTSDVWSQHVDKIHYV